MKQIHKVCHALMDYQAIDATTAYVLVDLSDTTNYRHTGTNAIHLLNVNLAAETHSDGIFDAWLGVITEVDASNGTAEFIHVFHLENRQNPTDDQGHWAEHLPFAGPGYEEGWNLTVNADTAASEFLQYVETAASLAGNAAFKTGTGLGSPAGAAGGATGKPGAGDLVLYLEEVTTGGTIDFCISVTYYTT